MLFDMRGYTICVTQYSLSRKISLTVQKSKPFHVSLLTYNFSGTISVWMYKSKVNTDYSSSHDDDRSKTGLLQRGTFWIRTLTWLRPTIYQQPTYGVLQKFYMNDER